MTPPTETVEGYVIDVGCIRQNARDDLLAKARQHESSCALMGHCVESGYGIVTEDDRVTVLDSEATPRVVDVIEDSDTTVGIRLRVERVERDGSMETTAVEEVSEGERDVPVEEENPT
ncbi:hypothetical protein VB773_02485 [Haloarculaceae archaeon H-GB2-1]|nr:hypothetical protein [Haloarculaceae archaeon H-GB1-1]MEA5406557.1 hypothetical protein [Haloarculaceae archaeon H-GB2-1]